MYSRYQIHDDMGQVIFVGDLKDCMDYINGELYVAHDDIRKADENPDGYICVFPLPTGEQGYISVLC